MQLDSVEADPVAPQRSSGSSGSGLKRHASDASDTEPLAVKKARRQLETLRELRDNVKIAVEGGHWHSTNALHHDTVTVHVSEALAILDDVCKEPNGKTVAIKFGKFFARTLMSVPAFGQLQHFVGTFSRLENMCGETFPEGLLLEALAKIDPASDAVPDLSVSDAVSRTTIRGSSVYNSFVVARVSANLEKARRQNGKERLETLLACSGLPNVPDALKITIADALVLFDVRVPLGLRAKHLVLSPSSAKLAAECYVAVLALKLLLMAFGSESWPVLAGVSFSVLV